MAITPASPEFTVSGKSPEANIYPISHPCFALKVVKIAIALIERFLALSRVYSSVPAYSFFQSVNDINSSGFPAISAIGVLGPLPHRVVFCSLHALAVRFTNLRYFFSQLSDALFNGRLHGDRPAG
jgi:hypothetical protein